MDESKLSKRVDGPIALWLIASLVVGACSTPTTDNDAGFDAGSDVASDAGPDASADAAGDVSCTPPPDIPSSVTIDCSPLPPGSTEGCRCPIQHPAAPSSSPAPVCDDAGTRYPANCVVRYPFVYSLYPCEVPTCTCTGGSWVCPL